MAARPAQGRIGEPLVAIASQLCCLRQKKKQNKNAILTCTEALQRAAGSTLSRLRTIVRRDGRGGEGGGGGKEGGGARLNYLPRASSLFLFGV